MLYNLSKMILISITTLVFYSSKEYRKIFQVYVQDCHKSGKSGSFVKSTGKITDFNVSNLKKLKTLEFYVNFWLTLKSC